MTENVLLLSGRAETDALGKAISALRSGPDGLEQLAPQLEMLAARCAAYPAETRQLWDWFEQQHPCGEAEEMGEMFEGHLRLLDGRLRVVQEVQALAAEVGRRRGQSPHEAPLAAALADLSAQRDRIAGLVERLNAPMPPWTGPTMTRAERLAAFERGEYEDAGTILERVRNGGPVSKD